MEKELFSRLPEDLIHLIFGFLSTKDAVKASFVSKSLQAAWLSSCPALHFDVLKDAFDDINGYHKYVFNTMERISNHSITSFSYVDRYYDSETLDKYIGIALDGHVCEICLCVGTPEMVTYCLPERVLSSIFLESLCLVWMESDFRLPGGGADDINLPCLQSLTLSRVSMNNGESLRRLLKGCPSLEHLNITTETLTQISISIYHLKLKYLSVYTFGSSLVEFEVEAPCLETFHCNIPKMDDMSIKSTSKLKCLSLHLYSYSSPYEWLSKLLSNCTSLETLKLCLRNYVKTISISSPYVKNMVITYESVAEIVINCPMLLSLHWTLYRIKSVPTSLSVINHQPNFQGHLHMCYLYDTKLNSAWFHKLREFLSTSPTAAMSFSPAPGCEVKEVKNQNADNESLPTSSVKIELLYVFNG